VVIEKYIKQRNQIKNESTGVDRANRLKERVTKGLLQVEGLSELQLLWRVYDYVFSPQGAYPLETSKTLRKVILVDLCNYLGITNELLSNKVRELSEAELQLYSRCVLPAGFYQSDKKTIETNALKELIASALKKKADVNHAPLRMDFVDTLKKIFTQCDAEMHFNHIQNQWLGIEALNEHQFLCRLSEQIFMSMTSGYGELRDNCKLRAKVALLMCQHLGVDEAVIRRENFVSLGGPFYVRSPFGPVYDNHNLDQIFLESRLTHINKALRLRAPNEFVDMSHQKDQSIELQCLGNK